MTIQQFNNLPVQDLKNELFKCCGSSAWVEKLVHKFPFNSIDDLIREAGLVWESLTEAESLEAFSHHPKIGDLESLEKKFASTKVLAAQEQSSVNTAPQKILKQLAEKNKLYENKFGFIFIVCATGKSAEEMLSLLDSRINNSRETEFKIAAEEQNKITRLRLQKLIS